MKVIAFQAKVSRGIENFLGLKSRIFITEEFILRHESPSETCLKGSTFICHEGAKTRSWLRPQNIITPALPDGSACPLILRGLLYAKCDPDSPLKIRGVPPKAGGCYELMDNGQLIIDNLRKKWGS
jgi:hypothetical protein